ncbi:MAG: hypothetical protein U5K29_04485 [Acidimicrobiales bacterium]|nr:hypothetical protein [Acidimicrobiales bacterium]
MADDSIVHALSKISRNRAGLIYCVSPHGALEGVLSDGTSAAGSSSSPSIDLEQPVLNIANRRFVSAGVDDPAD